MRIGRWISGIIHGRHGPEEMLYLPVNAYQSAALHRMVLADVNAQPTEQRIIVKRCLLGSRSPVEVARELHIPAVTVRICLLYERLDIERRARGYAREQGLRLYRLRAAPLYAALAEADQRAGERSATAAGKAAVLVAVREAIRRLPEETRRSEERIRSLRHPCVMEEREIPDAVSDIKLRRIH